MNNNVNRKMDIRNFVQKIGENHFGGINKLLKAKLDFMEEVISLLQLVRITVAESEANPKLAAIYTKEAAHICSTTTAGKSKTLSEVKQYFDDDYDEIFKLFVAIRKMPELDLIEYYNRNEPDMEAAGVVQEAFSHFCKKERVFISVCSNLLFDRGILPILTRVANVLQSQSDCENAKSRMQATGEVKMSIGKELRIRSRKINDLRKEFGKHLGEAEDFANNPENRDAVYYVYFCYFNPGKKILESCSTSDEMGTLFPPRTGRLDFDFSNL